MGVRGSDSIFWAAFRYGLAAVVLLLVAQGAQAAATFKCDGHGVVAFQGTPCAAHTAQTEVDVRQQPLIDPDAPPYIAHDSPVSFAGHARTRRHARSQAHATSRRAREDKQPVSYECHASDGEVFYRHSKCPASVRGDGIARFGAERSRMNSRRGRHRSGGGAWDAVPVKGIKISRSEACRAINALAADGRDGHARDEQVSVYEHNMGRDPCSGV